MSNNTSGVAVPAKLMSWLEEQGFRFIRFGRECADAVKVAQLIKQLWPKLVDLHNYPPQNSTALKLANWEVLNRKALSKLGVPQKSATLEQLAKGETGVAETLLLGIMQIKLRQDYKEDTRAETEQEKAWMENDELLIVNINRKIGDNDNIIQMPEKLILYSIYEEKSQENEQKDAQIKAFEQKIAHLESMLMVKDARIEELDSQIGKLAFRANSQDESNASQISLPKKPASEINIRSRATRKLDPTNKLSNLLLRRTFAQPPNSTISVVNEEDTRADRTCPEN